MKNGSLMQDHPCEDCGEPPQYIINIGVEKRPTNETEGLAWMPSDEEVLQVVRDALLYTNAEIDAGWIITHVIEG